MPTRRRSEDYWEWLTRVELARARADQALGAREGASVLPGIVDLHHAREALAELVLEGWCNRARDGWQTWRDDLQRIVHGSHSATHVAVLLDEVESAEIDADGPEWGGRDDITL